ncbi:CaiB/BaiF CoA-transferase family protein [Pseudonocardia sp. KRD291]|uniref:CaiB/BaiF CoA transferase family protein n=1 Tax=Pseudonocardia sp. KRD291 TaxID=2792007 RepID=UPI001C4A6E7F|nr:CoA transferase [Pseudonocardia sp. KRD291]MBW0106188.1 CoA transferase [Pseudonocardia sp. KRD291]
MVAIMNGIRVLEVASWTYVPVAGGILAEWGADVLKVEHPETGDPQRGLVTSGLVPQGGVAHMVELPNRGKRSVGLDLKSEEGRELLLELAARADVFLTNFLPAARTKLRIDVEDIRAVNPRIVYVRGSAHGQHGPDADRGGYDNSTFWARSGAADTASPDELGYPVTQPGAAFGDVLGGLTIAGGISAALLHRERTGEALTVDNSLLATGAWANGANLAASAAFGIERIPRYNPADAPNALVNSYRTQDGRFVSLVMLESDRYWPELTTALGRPDLVTDPRFADHASRMRNNKEAIAEISALFGALSFAEAQEVLGRGRGAWAPVQTPLEVLDDPQVVANGYLNELKDANGTPFRLVPAPLQFNGETGDTRRAPVHGEHTDEVLGELGLDMDRILELKISGAVL